MKYISLSLSLCPLIFELQWQACGAWQSAWRTTPPTTTALSSGRTPSGPAAGSPSRASTSRPSPPLVHPLARLALLVQGILRHVLILSTRNCPHCHVSQSKARKTSSISQTPSSSPRALTPCTSSLIPRRRRRIGSTLLDVPLSSTPDSEIVDYDNNNNSAKRYGLLWGLGSPLHL